MKQCKGIESDGADSPGDPKNVFCRYFGNAVYHWSHRAQELYGNEKFNTLAKFN